MKQYLKLEKISIAAIFITLFGVVKTYFYWSKYNINIFNYLEPGEVIFTSTNSLIAISLILLGIFLGTTKIPSSGEKIIQKEGATLIVGIVFMTLGLFGIHRITSSNAYFYVNFSLIMLYAFACQKLINIGWFNNVKWYLIFIFIYAFIYLNNFIENNSFMEKEIHLKLINNVEVSSSDSIKFAGETNKYIFLKDEKDNSLKIFNKNNIVELSITDSVKISS